jgi:hypothetical protein
MPGYIDHPVQNAVGDWLDANGFCAGKCSIRHRDFPGYSLWFFVHDGMIELHQSFVCAPNWVESVSTGPML